MDLPSAPPASAPFLKSLKASRPAAPEAAPAPASTAATSAPAPRAAASSESEDLDTLSDLPPSDESFESATTMVPRAVLAERDVERDDADRRPAAVRQKPAPPLEEMVAKIPAETQDALEQLFRARFRAVRRIPPEQMR